MTRFQLVPAIFAVLSAVFLALAWFDHRRHDTLMNPARKAWLRVGLIFGAVAIFLLFFQSGLR